MPLNLSPESAAARDFAKRCVPDGEKLDTGLFISAVYHATHIRDRIPAFESFFEKPEEVTDDVPSSVPLEDELIPVLTNLAKRNGGPIDPEDLWVSLLYSPKGMEYAAQRGVTEEALNEAVATLKPAPAGGARLAAKPRSRVGWRATPQRAQVLEELNPFGRMLTEGTPPQEAFIGMELRIQAVLRTLVKRKQKSAIITGEPGTGKTSLVRELARRLVEGHPSIPARLRDVDIFEISPTFLRAGTTLVGQYEERIGTLLKTLKENPKVILFVDEVHSLLQSGIHERSNFTDANEAFKQALAQGELSLIGVTTTAEYRYYLEPDQALVQRFSLIPLPSPTPAEALTIVMGRLPELETFYDVDIPDAMVARAVDLTEEYLPGRAQPRKSIQLLDEVCAYCVTRTPPLDTVTEDALWEVLEDTIGHGIARQETLTEDGLFTKLSQRIVGQDVALRGVARAFVAGLGGWSVERESPRGVFFFGGPTGVGKTETALLLADVLGNGRESLLRIDCNTLQPSGTDSGHATNILLGPPPGYIGYVRGKGGALSRIRERPESIVLFDEIEKADPGVGELLLQILDTGRCEDTDGNLLDFRRAFIVFTTNAGVAHDHGPSIGFGSSGPGVGPTVDEERMKEEIRRTGLGDEFLGRITHLFMFQGLTPPSVRKILVTQLEKLQDTAEVRGYRLEWDDAVVDHLVGQWQPRFGVRHLLAILRNRIVEILSVADAQGELRGVRVIRLACLDSPPSAAAGALTGMAVRERDGATLKIKLG